LKRFERLMHGGRKTTGGGGSRRSANCGGAHVVLLCEANSHTTRASLLSRDQAEVSVQFAAQEKAILNAGANVSCRREPYTFTRNKPGNERMWCGLTSVGIVAPHRAFSSWIKKPNFLYDFSSRYTH